MTDIFEFDPAMSVSRRSPAESGSVAWTLGDAIPASFQNQDPASYVGMRLIAQLENGSPCPVVLHLRLSTAGSPFDYAFIANDAQFLGATPNPSFVVMIEYGDLAGSHRVVADCRSGSYQLPAVTYARVFALQWNAAAIALQANVFAAFSRGYYASSHPLTYTVFADVLTGGSASVNVPYYTQFVDVWATGWVGGIGAANAPILNAERPVSIYRDYTTGLFVPPWGPVSYSGEMGVTDLLTVDNAGPATVRVWGQFYLSL